MSKPKAVFVIGREERPVIFEFAPLAGHKPPGEGMAPPKKQPQSSRASAEPTTVHDKGSDAPQKPRRPLPGHWAGLLLLIVLFVVSRLILSHKLPPFVDELLYLRMGQLFSENWRFWDFPMRLSLMPLFPWIISLFLRLPVEPLFLGRLLSLLAGLGTIWGLWRLERDFFQRSGLTSIVIIVVCPFAIFHQAWALIDPLLCFLSIMTTLVVFRFFLVRPSCSLAFALGALPALAAISKAQGYFLFSIPVVAWLLFRKRLGKPAVTLRSWALALLGVFLILGPVVIGRMKYAESLVGAFIQTTDKHFLSPSALGHLPLALWQQNFSQVADWFLRYFGIGPTFMLAAAVVIACFLRDRRLVLLVYTAVTPIFVIILVGGSVSSRNLLFVLPQLILVLTEEVHRTAEKLSARMSSRKISAVILLVLAATLAAPASVLLSSPTTFPLPMADREQYFTGWPSGGGLPALKDKVAAEPGPAWVFCAPEGVAHHYFNLYADEGRRFLVFEASWWLARPLIGPHESGMNIYYPRSPLRESPIMVNLATVPAAYFAVRAMDPAQHARFFAINPGAEKVDEACGPGHTSCYWLFRLENDLAAAAPKP